MNDFLSQFLVECREFVEEATAGLLSLERAPGDTAVLDAVFRAFHTLKGGAGIVEFTAMERAVHAAEDVLSEARSGTQLLTGKRVGDCLSCLDQVVQWLDIIQETGELPKESDVAADAIVRLFTAPVPQGGPATSRSDTRMPDWVRTLLERHPPPAAGATTAVRYTPSADCFFHGEDPVSRITSLPALLGIALESAGAQAVLSTFDPFRCTLVLCALTGASVESITGHMAGCFGAFDVVPLVGEEAAGRPAILSASVRAILAAQSALLAAATPRNFVGFVSSAGRTAANVLRFAGRRQWADRVSLATAQSLAGNSIQALEDVLREQDAPPEVPVPGITVEPRRADIVGRTLRVDAGRIDALVRLTSELTVARNAAGHLAGVAQEEGNSLAGRLREQHKVLQHLVNELQVAVLGMRVLPLRSVLQRFPRIVRDLASAQGKHLSFDIEGDETEADKVIVEMLFEPLLHVLRNAVDHGIESPARRAERGKSATASIRIRVSRQADEVVIDVVDDGGGVDVDRVRAVAAQRGVVSREQLRTMSDAEVIELIFAPGFSTAAQLTELSGRGVGMDAVRTSVGRVGGRVSIDSQPGQGTTIRVALPFSVMISRVMTVEAAGQTFGVPLESIVETVRIPVEAIVGIGAAQAAVVRDRTVPVVSLSALLGLPENRPGETQATLVVAAAAGQVAALRVDRIGEQLDVILQPLDGLLAGTPGISGTTLLGDGRVLLVLDIAGVLQ